MSAEGYFIAYLTAQLSGTRISGSVPDPMPDEFVTVELTGSRQVDKIDRPTLTVLSWSTSRAAACDLFEQVNAAMMASTADWQVSRVELETGYNDTDEETHRPRYHARYGIVYLGG